jgi:polysaccharide deacetylase 2 family uncharacterized protein YibQ
MIDTDIAKYIAAARAWWHERAKGYPPGVLASVTVVTVMVVTTLLILISTSGPGAEASTSAEHAGVDSLRAAESQKPPVEKQGSDGNQNLADAQAFHEGFEEAMRKGLRRIGFGPHLIEREVTSAESPERWRIRVPENFPLLRVNAEITQIVEAQNGRVFRAEQDSVNLRTVYMHVGSGNVATDRVTLSSERRLKFKGTIAFVIDDVGYRPPTGTMSFIQLPYAVTLAVLPNHQGVGARIAKMAIDQGKDVMLHLPMEPSNASIPLEPNTILVSMDDDAVRSAVNGHIESIPGIVGINNHMGSRATEDARVMGVVIDVCERLGIFFLDSRTSSNTVAEDLARERGIFTGRRSVFLDNEKSVSHVLEKIRQTARIAEQEGSAIAIGHDRDATSTALAEALPILEREGFRIAMVRELMR